ncbi:MAG: hypothetical protein J6R88_05595 [Clostridia bacterium]|nr:hypothetical protein [Clostridia bacterium]
MVKRKVVLKSVPPDVSAVKLLLGLREADVNYKNLTDDELEAEKQRLLKILLEEENENNYC